MSVPVTTVQVAISLWQITGQPLPNARVQFGLTKADVQTGSGLVLPAPIDLFVDANGTGVATLFANVDGLQGTQTSVAIYSATGQLQYSGYASIPAFNCNLHDVLNLTTPSVTDAQTAVNTARDWALRTGSDVPEGVAGDRSSKSWAQEDLTPSGQNRGGSSKDWAISSTLPDGVNPSAKTSAAAAAASAVQTAADRVQTGADRVQTDADVVAANAAKAQSNSNMLTAIAQASLASIYALSAASVAQQDLSGVTAAALHRGPAAVVAMCIDDPRTHSDGGAWTQKVDHLSWMNEPLQGAWLDSSNAGPSGIKSELEARCQGATLGVEQITGADPGFGSAAGWNTFGAAGVSISNGTLIFAPATNTQGASTTITAPVTGQLYRAVITINSLTQGAVRIFYGGNFTQDFTTAGTYTVHFAATAGATTNLSVIGIGTTTAVIDSVSIKPVTALTTTSGSYYQDSTDGKFKKLNKNVIGNSSALDQAPWAYNHLSVVPNATTDHNGALLADKLVEDGANNTHYAKVTAAGLGPSYSVMTFSCYAKAGERSKFALSNLANFFNVNVDLVAGTAVATNGAATITNLGGGIYRISATSNGVINTAHTPNITLQDATGSSAYQGDGVSGLYVWGVQLEYGSVMTALEDKTSSDLGTTEVFRGNVAHYGRTAWVAEASRVVGYAIDQPGRPAWMSITTGANFMLQGTITSVAATNGALVVGTNSGAFLINFAKDAATKYSTAADATFQGRISSRGVANGYL